jgi:carboxymethylenebutenolidase
MAGSMIEYAANGGKASGYLARPDGAGNGKGLIVIQEWWGLVPHIRDVTDRFAALGYLALAPDLWDGKKTTDADEAGRLFMALNVEDAARKLRGAAAALKAQGAAAKVGVIGYCMGGILAVYTAGAHPDVVGAAVDYYGVHPNVHPAYDQIKAPVLLVAGEKDAFVTPAAARRIKEEIEAAGGTCELHVYPAGHAFFNDSRPDAYDAESAKDVWGKTVAFLERHL